MEMICVFDPATSTSGFGVWFAAPPHGLNRMVSLGPIGRFEFDLMSAPLRLWRRSGGGVILWEVTHARNQRAKITGGSRAGERRAVRGHVRAGGGGHRARRAGRPLAARQPETLPDRRL